jgi:hypothetical protein
METQAELHLPFYAIPETLHIGHFNFPRPDFNIDLALDLP